MDKEQTTVGLSSEDEELLNQNLPSHTAESTAQNATEKESTDVVKVILQSRKFYYKS